MKMYFACSVCGKRTNNGTRCEKHNKQAFRSPVSCVVCGRKSAYSYCDDHRYGAERDEIRNRQQWRAGYNDPEYRKNRQRALQRSGFACERCGRTDLPLEVDHILPLSEGLKKGLTFAFLNSMKNLQVRCVSCHARKTMNRDR